MNQQLSLLSLMKEQEEKLEELIKIIRRSIENITNTPNKRTREYFKSILYIKINAINDNIENKKNYIKCNKNIK